MWKAKEKEISLEEALDIARKDILPYWFGLSPQFAGVQIGEKKIVLPLDLEFSKKTWIIFILDPTSITAESVQSYIKECFRRYKSLGVNFLVIYDSFYSYLKIKESIQLFVDEVQLHVGMVFDVEEILLEAFEGTAPPKVILFNKGKSVFGFSGKDWLVGTELELQKFLRTADPGLSLMPPLESASKLMRDVVRYEFGYRVKDGWTVSFPAPGFKSKSGDVREALFQGNRPAVMSEDEFFIAGKWEQTPEKIMTSDPTAVIGFKSVAANICLIAESNSKTPEIPSVSLEINGNSAHDAVIGKTVSMDESGFASLKIQKPKLYHLLVNLPKHEREITLRFTNADVAPLSLYGLRLGE